MAHTLNSILNIHKATKGLGYSKVPNSYNELEVKFGTKQIKRITKLDYNNVINKLKSCGYSSPNMEGDYTLKIFLNDKQYKNIRIEIAGFKNIHQYCKINKLEVISGVTFIRKENALDEKNNSISPIDKDAFNLRYTYKTEFILEKEDPLVVKMLKDWDTTKKIFRYINRVHFQKASDLRLDLSVVKSNKVVKRNYVSAYNIEEANIFNNDELYEIEIELVGEVDDFIEQKIKELIKVVLSGLQQSNYPISYFDQENILKDYGILINKKGKLSGKDFIGPSSVTLQHENIMNIDKDCASPNIRENYTVTEKADGERKLLYVHSSKKIYLITLNMEVQYTGSVVKNEDYINTILDGEHILRDKEGNFINLFMCFDIYFLKGQSLRQFSFINNKEEKEPMRLSKMCEVIRKLNPVKYNGKEKTITISEKSFYWAGTSNTIFDVCAKVLNSTFIYNTDGLIFTPMHLPVGGSELGKPAELKKIRWDYSFKWKPPEFNTIDFLVTTKKDDQQKDVVINKFNEGTDMSGVDIASYKILILRVGYDEKRHGYINPCQMIIDDQYHSNKGTSQYKPVPFYPTNPSDDTAHMCKIKLDKNSIGGFIMKTRENQVFEDNMIVEFSYHEGEWIPLRVRYDKTAEYKSGQKNYGNAYHVANSNWYSIHHPITHTMLSTGKDINIDDQDIYYNRKSKETKTKALRDFHNQVVKKTLIELVANKGNTLIDLAVGKAGDLPKWSQMKLSFVFGIDIMNDNIDNPIDGACARYLNLRKRYRSNKLSVLFVRGNSSFNIKDGAALFTEKDKMITKAVMGLGPKDKTVLGEGVFRQYGKGENGFDITSCQFAAHYFFENVEICSGFFKNVVQLTKKDGYFIGTCYDGYKIFKLLDKKSKGESVQIIKDDKKIWEITKQYDNKVFNANQSSLGYAIDVYQESINKTFREYLVHFDYLIYIMKNLGFIVYDSEDIKGVASFETLYKGGTMSNEEKMISFNNKYFIFKKQHDVNVDEMLNILFKKSSTKLAVKIKKLKLVQKI